MEGISRREFMFVSSGAAAGTFLAPAVTFAGPDKRQEAVRPSGLETGRKIPLPHKSIPGFLTERQMTPHYEAHYGGALRGYLAADERLQAGNVQEPAYGALQRARSSKGNSVVLHELYFEAMAKASPDPGQDLEDVLKARFGSLDRWAMDFVAAAGTAAGWALLAFHPVNGKLYNVVSDEHDTGVLWMATPLIALDVYEHAYYLDYENRKGDYVSKFMEHIDWNQVRQRYKTLA